MINLKKEITVLKDEIYNLEDNLKHSDGEGIQKLADHQMRISLENAKEKLKIVEPFEEAVKKMKEEIDGRILYRAKHREECIDLIWVLNVIDGIFAKQDNNGGEE